MCEFNCAGLDLANIFNIFLYVLFVAAILYGGFKLIKKLISQRPVLSWEPREKADEGDEETDGGLCNNMLVFGLILTMAAIILAGCFTVIGYILGSG